MDDSRTTQDIAAETVADDAATLLPPTMGIAVEHRSRVATGVALAAAVMTIAWFARALQSGEVLAWVWCLVLGTIAVGQLIIVRDSSAPLLLADDQGVRVRDGETWAGLRWPDIDHVDVRSAKGLRDGEIVVHPRAASAAVGSPELPTLSVPLAATTRLRCEGLTGDLVADLDSLASGRTPVVVVTGLTVPEEVADEKAPAEVLGEAPKDAPEDAPAEAPAESVKPVEPVVQTGVEVMVLSGPAGADGLVLPHQLTPEERDEVEDAHVAHAPTTELEEPQVHDVRPVSAFDPVAPTRDTRRAARSEVVRDTVRAALIPIPMQRETSQEPMVVARVDDLGPRLPRPAEEAVIGPVIAAARNRARLSIDTLSERTRIRPHVLECIEVDDFEPCGGDFYARGHLRTLARVFGLDAAELLAAYDEHYAQPVIEARQVFEAELATGIGGGMRATSTGPRWSILAAAVVALGMVWGGAHFFTDQPEQIVSPAPQVDSAGLARATSSAAPQTALAALAVTATGASPQVVVRDRDGRILWAGKLADGQRQQVVGLAPFDVTASNGAAVKVTYLGRSKGTVGSSAAADSKQFG